ncbi:nucleoside triphosphate pyrophosphohydrolase [Gabonibacter chumensis]|uniref:nucleoside triphosphate pyrophosphohydrolase n=1 Tax=Gabonibacter chumensis TaxID=2972474 RepID=UPI00257401B9|nr:nucleoside triphosphate pyrophosphohydrolase [Gabonibacter chumensis]MCR9013244.1 nucleoside triphosphate pyrophosphohydrolase [Gabonibacter chumensis]
MSQDIEKRKEAFADLLDIIATLRVKCPWDKKQTLESLRNLTVEEVYELGDAILKKDMQEVKKELGDLIMHIVFYARIGEEQQQFDIEDVLVEICEKLRYRHPHIYGEVQVENEDDVLRNWEQLKLKEKSRHHKVLEGVPSALPAMIKAFRVQDKVRGVGFDWKQKQDVWKKVREELDELQAEMQREDTEKMEEEFGDFMFALVNAARLYGINPEDALEKTNRKFIRRFSYMESKANESGVKLADMSLEEMDGYWNEAKRREKTDK